MIIEKESEINVLRYFCSYPFDYFSIPEISEKIGMSRNWAYRIIRKFEKSNILSISGKRYKLDFSEPFCKRLKLLIDSEYISCMNEKTKISVFNIANKLIFELNPISIVLVGSAALGKQKKDSDIDFLVIGEKKELPYFENCNIVLLAESEFKEKYLKGDDFIISSLLFGKIIFDNNVFIKFFENPLPIFSQEIIQEKIKYCEKLEERIYALLKTDEEKAKEDMLHLALQAARIIMLRNKIIPKTKYDVADQIKQFNKGLSAVVKGLLEGKKISKEKIIEHIKTCVSAIS